jgi:hypothetical protein
MKSNVLHQNIRPQVVIDALLFLKDTPLYKSSIVQISKNWLDLQQSKIQEWINTQNSLEAEDSQATEIIDEEDEQEGEPENPGIQATMMFPTEITWAPGENIKPTNIRKDADAERLAFPTIYAGQTAEYKINFTDTEIAKSEFMQKDRRCAKRPEKLFATCKKLEYKKIYDGVTLCLRKKKKQDNQLTAANLVDEARVNELVQCDDGFRILRSVRSSPSYWSEIQKKVLAMIRQLGIPTFFVTFSAAES